MACAATICRDVDAHQMIRMQSVDELEAYPAQYAPFMEFTESFGDHCVRMRKDYQWGGMVQLQAIAEVSRRIIRVYRSDEPEHRGLYTDYLPQRSAPIGECVEILYDYHGSHYWYIQKDMMPVAAQHCDRRSMLSALDKWQTLWVKEIDESALCEKMVHAHKAAAHYWIKCVMTASTRKWRQSVLDSRCRQLQWRQIRVELLAQLHFRERYLVASLNHIRQTASRLRDQVDKSVTEVMNLSRDDPMPIYLEVASQDSHGADVATLARMFMPGGMGGGSDDASGKASASSRLWLRLHVLSLQRRKVARGRVRLWSAFDQFWWSVTLPQSAHWRIRLEARKIYRSLSNSQSDG